MTTIFYRIRNNSVDLFEVSYAIDRGFPNDFNKGERLATSLIRTIETEDQSRRLPHVRIAEMTEEYD